MILIGGRVYLLGVIFYLMGEISLQPRLSGIFFVLAAAVCHLRSHVYWQSLRIVEAFKALILINETLVANLMPDC